MTENRFVIACAGAGKTRRLVEEALAHRNGMMAIVTYTNNNVKSIARRFIELNSGVPNHVEIMTWYGFLMRECARPYQRARYAKGRIESIYFVQGQSTSGVPEANTRRYYFASDSLIYSDKIARFVVECEKTSAGAITSRLGQLYSGVAFDECQDLAAWDWNVIELLLRSAIRVILVGDPRQSVLSTNLSRKNSRYRQNGITALIDDWEAQGLCKIETMNETRRCNRSICEFANRLWPGMERMAPVGEWRDDHCGVFLVAKDHVESYCELFAPQVLKHDKKVKFYGREGMNFGASKGMEFNRVLIVPTGPITTFLKTGDPAPLKGKYKLHVAVTRARYSVAFVYEGQSPIVPNRWTP